MSSSKTASTPNTASTTPKLLGATLPTLQPSERKSSKQQPKAPAKPIVKKGKITSGNKSIYDYMELIETVARVEASRLPRHLIDYSELVNIGAVALHVMFSSNPEREYNITYLSTAMKWAIRNELRNRYKWYSLQQVKEVDEETEDGDFEDDHQGSSVREVVYETILSVDSMMEADNPHEIADSDYTPEETTELSEMGRLLRECMNRLPERDRQVLEARFFKHLRMREIGSLLEISPSRTSRVIQSALDKLKVELARKGYVGEL